MGKTILISGASDILDVTDEISRCLRNNYVPEVTIKVPRDQKTARQRGYFYGGIIEGALSEEPFKSLSDFGKEEMEDLLISITINDRIRIGNNVDIPRLKSVSSMDTEEMSRLIDVSLHWLVSEFGIVIDTPEEYYAKQWTNHRKEKHG
jgi:hypothetical protein